MADWTTQFRDIHRPNARGIARHASLDALSMTAHFSGAISRDLAIPRVHFVYLHHVFDDEVEWFGTLVASLLKHMTPLTYSDAVRKTLAGPIDRPYVCFSFDDGFKNNLVAADLLDAQGVKACFFVCPQIVGERDRETIAAFTQTKLHLPPVEFLDWADLDSLCARGHEIGNHTLSHEDLALTTTKAHEEVERGLALLRLRIGDVKHFAWPYGHFRAINSFVRDVVYDVGHASCASGQRGAHVVPAGDARKLCIRRDHVIAAWPLRHVMYLLSRSARQSTAETNNWPTDLL